MAWNTTQLNAAFDAVETEMHLLVDSFVPFMFKQQARAALDSAEGRKRVLDALRRADAAADAAK